MDFIHGDDLPRLLRYNKIRAKTPEKVPNIYEARIIDSEGEEHLCQINVDKIPFKEEYVVSVLDLTPLKNAQHQLEESEKKYREIFEHMQDIFYQTDKEGKILDISPSIYKYTGYSREELIGTNMSCLYFHPPDRLKLIKEIEKKGEVANYEIQLKNKDQQPSFFSFNAHLIRDSAGEQVGLEGSIRDISDYKDIQNELQYRVELENLIMDISKNFINQTPGKVDEAINEALKRIGLFLQVERSYLFQLKPGGDVLIKTHGWCRENLYLRDELWELKISDYPWSKKILKNEGQLYIPEREALPPEAENEKKILKFQDIQSLTAVPLKIKDKMIGFIGFDSQKSDGKMKKEHVDLLVMVGEVFTNLMEKRDAEEAIKQALEEKEVLLQEVNHRVKNNMQIISSLLNLQLNYEVDENTRHVLSESRGRIRTMAMIHEKLYQSSNITQVNFGEYLQKLVKDLFYTYGVSPQIIKPVIQAQNTYVNIDTSIPLGLMVNELVTNSLKYAFPDGENGKVKIKFEKTDGKCLLEVEDDGVGLPPDLDVADCNSLGLKLVNSLAQQLDADLEVKVEDGTSFSFTFKELQYRDRI